MERFGPLPGAPVAECERLAAEAHLVMCIVVHRYGYEPEAGRGSITRREVESARNANKSVYAWIVDDKYPWTEPKEQDRRFSETRIDAGLFKREDSWLYHSLSAYPKLKDTGDCAGCRETSTSQPTEDATMPGKVQTIESGTDVTITLNADTATVTAGGKGQESELFLANAAGTPSVFLSTKPRHLMFRADPAPGKIQGPVTIHINAGTPEISLFGPNAAGSDPHDSTVHLRGTDGVVRAGGNGVDGRILVLGKDTTARITLEGSSGDIVLANADCAEEFDADESEEIAPGAVMILDDDGKLRMCVAAYDKRVAGVFSGAGEYRPAIVLDRQPGPGRRIPIALLGKTCCKADAQYGPIERGDLLTTSPTAGFAMKAADPRRAFGAVIGKALRPLPAGTGLIPILVALQ